MMRGRWWWVVAVVSVLLLAGLAWFLAGQQLDKADKWASVIGMFVGIVGLLSSVYSLLHAGRSTHSVTPQPPAAPTEPGAPVTSTISGGQFHAPVVMGRDLRRVSLTGAPVPVTYDPDAAAAPDPDAGPQTAGVENRVENVTMAGPLLMGRDMTDIVLPPHTPPVVPPGAVPEGGDGTGR